MRASLLKPSIAAAFGLGLLALPLAALVAPRSGSYTETVLCPPWRIHWLPSTPYRTTMREAVYWWEQAVQRASDETDEQQTALRTWDPAARFDRHAERQQALIADHGGYRRRALALLHKAARQAATPAERRLVERRRQRWERTIRGEGLAAASRFLYN